MLYKQQQYFPNFEFDIEFINTYYKKYSNVHMNKKVQK